MAFLHIMGAIYSYYLFIKVNVIITESMRHGNRVLEAELGFPNVDVLNSGWMLFTWKYGDQATILHLVD